MIGSHDFQARFEWLTAEQVAADELRATWARLELWVGEECVTEVLDTRAGSTRTGVYLPLYPVAEWVAYNWWFLTNHSRPAAVPGHRWTMRAAQPPAEPAAGWLAHHNLRAVGEGLSLPDLTIVPEGSHVRLRWNSDRQELQGPYPVRFLGSGEAFLPKDTVVEVLWGLVDTTRARLTEVGVGETPMSKEWDAIQGADHEETAFCEAAASLGLDPYAEAPDVADLIQASYESLHKELFSDFVNAVRPDHLERGLNWVNESARAVARHEPTGFPSPTELRGSLPPPPAPEGHQPWRAGIDYAQRLRSELAIDPTSRFDPERFVSMELRPSGDRSLQALGGTSESGEGIVELGHDRPDDSKRFVAARSLWRLLSGGDAPFLITSARLDRQKAERAFAAELLAPAQGIAERLETDPALATDEDVEAVAESFRVSDLVVLHQIENHLTP